MWAYRTKLGLNKYPNENKYLTCMQNKSIKVNVSILSAPIVKLSTLVGLSSL